ncbi:MAG: pilus assembly protein PilP [Desulfobacteraceae bacterium]|nr:pilus assembly protein PilP [Desulfobacteraceae bacterium]
MTKKIVKPDQKKNIDQTKIQQDKKPAEVKQPEPVQKPAEVKQPEPKTDNYQASKQNTDSNNLSIDEKLKDDLEKDKSKTLFYVSEGKIDPFLSPMKKNDEKEKNKIENRKYTPLEKLDLSQLKLVAIINMQRGKKDVAMVQESSGKGYMVKVGTYIGTNNGRIVEIKNDEIIIKERIKNFKGVFEDHLKNMKLQKKSDR